VQVTTGDTDGTVTEVTGGDLKPGMKVITGQLASESGTSQRRQGSGQRRRGANGGAGGQSGGQ
jgi:HlyD family secretion protein